MHLDDMRTTMTINDTLLKRAKERAVRENCTLSEIVNDALRYRLVERPSHLGAAEEAPLKTYGKGGLQGGVDLSSNAALGDLMEGR
jgi:hypothetical protein